jgi:hypothetical protein
MLNLAKDRKQTLRVQGKSQLIRHRVISNGTMTTHAASYRDRAIAANFALRYVTEVSAFIVKAGWSPDPDTSFYELPFLRYLASFHHEFGFGFGFADDAQKRGERTAMLIMAVVAIIRLQAPNARYLMAGSYPARAFYGSPDNMPKQLAEVAESYEEMFLTALGDQGNAPKIEQ